MQSIAGTNLATIWASGNMRPVEKIEVAWDGSTWVDETAYVKSWSIEQSIYDARSGLPQLGNGIPAKATVTLDNGTHRFSRRNAASPLYTAISGGIYRVPIRISAGYLDGVTPRYLRQFTGEIEQPDEQETEREATVTLSCLDLSIGLLEQPVTTTMREGLRIDEFMAVVLGAAGYTGASALDKSSVTLPYAWCNDEPALQELRRLAAADGGMIHFAKDGTFRYWRLSAFLERADSVTSRHTLGSASAWALGNRHSWKNAYSKVLVPLATLREGPLTELYSAPEAILVEPASTHTFRVQFRWPAYRVLTPSQGNPYYCVTAGNHSLSSFNITSVTVYGQQADVSIQNTHPYFSMYVWGFKIYGYPLLSEGAEDLEREAVGGLVPADKEYKVPQNAYLQSDYQAEMLGDFLSDRLQHAPELWVWQGPAIPWLEVGDRVTVVDSPAGLNHDALIVGIQQESRFEDLYTETLTLLPVENLYKYSGYFTLGTSSYAASSDRVFY